MHVTIVGIDVCVVLNILYIRIYSSGIAFFSLSLPFLFCMYFHVEFLSVISLDLYTIFN